MIGWWARDQTGECVYKIQFHNCNSTYIGETGLSYGNRQEERRKQVESISISTLIRADQKDLATETNTLAITDHVTKENQVIDWSGAEILDTEAIVKQNSSSNLSAYRRPTVWTKTEEPTTCQRPMTLFWSRAHHRQHHVTITCLMKFAVGERNIAFRYVFLCFGWVI